MRYALTGATGFVGGVLARQLREAGHDVVALVRTPGRATDLEALGVQLVAGDLADTAALDRLLTGDGPVDGLFHVAGWYRVGTAEADLGRQVNVEGTRHVMAAARRAGTPRVVYTSTLAVNSDTGGAVRDETFRFTGEHLSFYDETKAEAHQIVDQFAADGLPVVTVMPGAVYGPGDTSQVGGFMADVVAGRRPTVPKGGGTLMWAHVADVAHGHLLAMEKGTPGESYMLAGEPATLAEVLDMVADLAGTKGPILVPDTVIRASGRLLTPLAKVARLPESYHPETVRVALASYVGSPAKAETQLGWQARSLAEGLAETVEATAAGSSG